jgi:hypothetical protein
VKPRTQSHCGQNEPAHCGQNEPGQLGFPDSNECEDTAGDPRWLLTSTGKILDSEAETAMRRKWPELPVICLAALWPVRLGTTAVGG